MDQVVFETKKSRNLKIKKSIFEAALPLIKAKGYDNVTIRDICSAAEISTGMFYRHFESKEQILDFYCTIAAEKLEHFVPSDEHDASVIDQIVEYYLYFTRYTMEIGLDFWRHFFTPMSETLMESTFHDVVIAVPVSVFEYAQKERGLVMPEGRSPRDIALELCTIMKGIFFDWGLQYGELDMLKCVSVMIRTYLLGVFGREV
ncbi:MAG: TetR/AcrR family transcriptional regulator [Oscillospiraceae bacterium]|nr:TetR/AcrR family transcriptional regulator [Oscillospiraceae bacterium]